MKFGKRVASEASRSSHQQHFLDYKACKRAIQQDVLANGVPQTAHTLPELPSLVHRDHK